jgi:hypothetical protein
MKKRTTRDIFSSAIHNATTMLKGPSAPPHAHIVLRVCEGELRIKADGVYGADALDGTELKAED